MITSNDLGQLLLRPAKHIGDEVELNVEFGDKDTIYSADINNVIALGMDRGDTVRISAKARLEDDTYEYISIYACGDTLDRFIEKYGVSDKHGFSVSGTIKMKFMFSYVVIEADSFLHCEAEELRAFILMDFE